MADPRRRFLTFRVDQRLYALPSEDVAEVIRLPAVARLPQSPRSLMGLANLRGSVLPVANLGRLLGHEERALGATSRAIVLRGESPVALAVERVEALVSVEADQVETRQVQLAAESAERISGAFQDGRGEETAKVLDIWTMLAGEFVPRAKRHRSGGIADAALATDAQAVNRDEKLVTFDVAGQEFALELVLVREITPVPEGVAAMPKSETPVLGVAAYREGLLPLLSLRGLLGFEAVPIDDRKKVIVTTVGGLFVGLVVDQMRAILSADAELIEPAPSMLTARTGGEAQITAIYRGEGGRRLVSILSPERLFREDVMRRLSTAEEAAQPQRDKIEGAGFEERRYLVFRLDEDEFALPIGAVDEVASVPARLTRLPKAPRFLEGVINLRGEVLPVVDQRKRFDMLPLEVGEKRRLVVMRTDRHRAGLIVDSVSEVLSVRSTDFEPAPDIAGERTRLVEGVLNLEISGRMILVLDPAKLLDRTEQDLLDAFRAEQGGS